MIRTVSLIAIGLCVLAQPAAAQNRADEPERSAPTAIASAALTVETALTVSGVRRMSFRETGGMVDAVAGPGSTEAIIEVTGDPGRVYRVQLPEMITADDIGSTIDTFTLRSDNSGDISETLTARMDAHGFDRLHVGGRLRRAPGLVITEVSAAIPLSIDYE